MPQDNTPDAYHAQPDEAFHGQPERSAAPEIVSTQPPSDPDFKQSGGRFVKGHDPRRHKFTREECSAGFWAGLASYVERGGETGFEVKAEVRSRKWRRP